MAEGGKVITIDGPSGSGKSTISRQLAARLHYTYLDTGAMYRAVGLLASRSEIAPDDEAAMEKLLKNLDLELLPGDEDTRVLLGGEDVSSAIRTAEMSMVASRVSALSVVRKKLTELQRTLGLRGAVVAEGRDTGTVVFPKAELKFYLDASPEERARRRSAQLREQGHVVDEKEILAQIKKRDQDDSARSLAPLKAATDAVVIDSSVMTIEEVVNFMLDQLD
ncbi:MAG: (d)CMP kinase [Thermodesulfobacteriota bacterium]|nr:(d)CMP kinase [Thermodesulfobacteriota bacterium]